MQRAFSQQLVPARRLAHGRHLSERHQAVWIDHCYSSYLPCNFGVPQGSILGPLIFLIFVNDLAYHLTCPLEQYADDTTLSASSSNVEEVSSILSENCTTVSSWMCQNKLKLNPDKTHVLMLGTQRRISNIVQGLNVHMDGKLLKESETNSETILGCQVQKNLKFVSI